jgi:hypothetical protein
MKKVSNRTLNEVLVNLTPHAVTIIKENGVLTIEPSGIIPRLKEIQECIGSIDGTPIFQKSFGEVENMPEQKEGKVYIVSVLVASALKHRTDVVIPNDLVRDEKGQIIGCKSLARV